MQPIHGAPIESALVAVPLSDRFRRAFETLIDTVPSYFCLSEQSAGSLVEAARRLHALRPRVVFLPIEHPSAATALPILRSLAAISQAQHIEIVLPDLRRQKLSRFEAGASLCSLIAGSLDGLCAAGRCYRDLKRLLHQPRARVQNPGGKRVLYINPDLSIGPAGGGAAAHVRGVIKELRRQGYLVDYAGTSPLTTGGEKQDFGALRPPPLVVPYELNLYRFHRQAVAQLRQRVMNGRYDLVYERAFLGCYPGVVLSRAANIPLILEYNHSHVWIARHWGSGLRWPKLASAAEDVCVKHAHLIVTVADPLRDELLSRGVEPSRIILHPNGIDPNTVDPALFSDAVRLNTRRKYNIPADAIVATFVGTFGHWHGVPVLARAIRQLVDEDSDWVRQSKLHFLLIGDGSKMAEVRETIGGSAYAPYVTMTGMIAPNDVPAHLAMSDLLLSPHVPNPDGSRFFGSPIKLFEYMAMGKTIIASNLEQIGEVLRPSLSAEALPSEWAEDEREEVAVTCRPGNVEDLLRAVRFVVDHQWWRQRLGVNARRKVEARFTWRHHVDAIVAGLGRARS